MKSFPFDSQITGTDSETGLPLMDRAQSAETLQKFFENLFQDGIFQNYENCCQVSPGSGMNVLVNVGGGCCGGSIFVEENIRTLALQAAHESLDRIDAIIVRKNNNINYRSTDLYVVTGNPAEIPVAPEPTRSSSIHEIVLAHVFVARGTTSIPSYRITDTRLDSSVCGIATPMQEVDTSGIFAQYQSALDEYLETVASAIDNTLAGNLQNQITALSNNQADAFSKTSTYSVGDYCIYQNVLKKCIKDVETAGDYDSTCWEDTTIGEEFSELNRKTEILNKTDQTPGSALKYRDATELGYTNLTFGYWEKGIYLYPGYLDGAPNDFSGLLLVFTDGSSFMKYAFAFDGNIYSMRQKVSDGTISVGWTKI